jgi:predicted nucleic acid-binding protein
MNVIANTTVISNFAVVGRLDVLRDLMGQVYSHHWH